jgi:hypothetical protein
VNLGHTERVKAAPTNRTDPVAEGPLNACRETADGLFADRERTRKFPVSLGDPG